MQATGCLRRVLPCQAVRSLFYGTRCLIKDSGDFKWVQCIGVSDGKTETNKNNKSNRFSSQQIRGVDFQWQRLVKASARGTS